MVPLPLAVRSFPALLAALLLPAAAADPIETAEPPLPLPVDPEDIVQVHHPDVDADPQDGGMGVSTETSVASTAILVQCAPETSCDGYVCLKGPGNGSLISFGDPGQGTFGVGADLRPNDSDAGPEDSEEGSYTGAFVNLQGQCGP